VQLPGQRPQALLLHHGQKPHEHHQFQQPGQRPQALLPRHRQRQQNHRQLPTPSMKRMLKRRMGSVKKNPRCRSTFSKKKKKKKKPKWRSIFSTKHLKRHSTLGNYMQKQRRWNRHRWHRYRHRWRSSGTKIETYF